MKHDNSCHGGFGYGSRNADDAKTVPYEAFATQYRPLICSLKIPPPRCKHVERCGSARIKWRRLKEKEAAVIPRIRLPTVTTVDKTWKDANDAIIRVARFEVGTTKPGRAGSTSKHGCGLMMSERKCEKRNGSVTIHR
ncbi:unnamed protein product [Heligmosomoides polygyrus]|uniref:Uncharacterized protein n=1 Tax=Heligmosomoides polygyrus TaxID=6339 RepID=A0A183GM95_HELPZ|nr:unnamed protein product [Heligmosomoides polygyrus]